MSANAIKLFEKTAHNPSFYEVSAAVPTGQGVLDFCVPVNLHYPKERLLSEITQNLSDIVKYYPDYACVHQDHIARMIDLPAEAIIVANGSTEIITELVRTADGPIVTCAPTFGQWTDLPPAFGKPVEFLFRTRADSFRLSVDQVIDRVRAVNGRMLVLSNPSNPTGVGMSLADIEEICSRLPDLQRIVIDESFIDFSDLESAGLLAARSSNVIVVKSLGKTLGWHGLRLGYAVASEGIARSLRGGMPYWNINGLAAFVLSRIADRPGDLARSLAQTKCDREAMIRELSRVEGLQVFPSQANFVFGELTPDFSGDTLRKRLLARHGIFIRACGNKIGSSNRYLRLAVTGPAAVNQLVGALRTELTASRQKAGCNA